MNPARLGFLGIVAILVLGTASIIVNDSMSAAEKLTSAAALWGALILVVAAVWPGQR